MTSSTVSALPQQSEAARILNSTVRERASAVHLLGRFLFSLIFIMSAAGHFSKENIAYAAAQGVPLASITVPFSGIVALLAGLSILLGYRAKLGAWVVVLFLIPVSLAMHKFWGVADPMMAKMQMAHFMKNVSILGSALLISQLGTGPWSLEGRGKLR
jgi:putative oxidoreductase